MKEKHLVTGGAGFIGSYLTERLLSEGYQVVVLDDFSQGSDKNLEKIRFHSDLEVIHSDITQKNFISIVEDQNPDVIWHFASPVGVDRVVQIHETVFDTHEKAGKELFNWAANKGKACFFASSSEVYGNGLVSLPIKESDALSPEAFPVESSRFLYARLKRRLELHGLKLKSEAGFSFKAVRFFNVFGERQLHGQGMVMPAFINAALSKKDLCVLGDGSQVRAFCPVNFAVSACLAFFHSDKTEHSVLNIGLEQPVCILELAKLILDLTGSPSQIRFISLQKKPGRKEEIHSRIPDISTLKELILEKEMPIWHQELEKLISKLNFTPIY